MTHVTWTGEQSVALPVPLTALRFEAGETRDDLTAEQVEIARTVAGFTVTDDAPDVVPAQDATLAQAVNPEPVSAAPEVTPTLVAAETTPQAQPEVTQPTPPATAE